MKTQMEDPMIEETLMDKIKASAAKSIKRIGYQSYRFREILYGKSPKASERMYPRANKIKDKTNHLGNSIRKNY